MQTIVLFHNSKWYAPIWILLFTLSLMLLWYRKEEWKKGFTVFFWSIFLSIIIVYCPLLAIALVPRFMPSYAEYERLSWLFFEIPLFSYVIIMLSKDIKQKRLHNIFLLCSFALLLFFGSPDNRDYYKKPENMYKISQDAVTICDKISALSPEGSVTINIQLNSWHSYYTGNGEDGALYYGIRVYESRYHLCYNCIAPEQYNKDGFIMPALPEDIDYYLCPKSSNIHHELERLGYSYVDESDSFSIFRNNKKTGIGGDS